MTLKRVEYTVVAYLPKHNDSVLDKAAEDTWELFKGQVELMQMATRFRWIFEEIDDE